MGSLEWLLVAGIAAFYLQDAAVLLHYDEFVVGGSGRRWRLDTGSTEWSGRYLWLPNPLAPHAAWFRGAWPGGAAGDSAADRVTAMQTYLAALAPFRAGTLGLASVLLVAVPLLIWRFPHPLALLAALGVAYGILVALVVLLWRRREALGVSAQAARWLAVECLACPPHAINLVRKLTLRHGPAHAAAVAANWADPPGRDRLARVMSQRQALYGAAP
jgi:hypothetical protein